MIEKIIWDYNPQEDKNFICILNNKGKWRLEEGIVFGKWIMTIKPKDYKNLTPSLADLKNFLMGLLEVEYKNDKFIFENGKKRNPQAKIRLNNFKEFLDKMEKEYDKKI